MAMAAFVDASNGGRGHRLSARKLRVNLSSHEVTHAGLELLVDHLLRHPVEIGARPDVALETVGV